MHFSNVDAILPSDNGNANLAADVKHSQATDVLNSKGPCVTTVQRPAFWRHTDVVSEP